MEFSESLAPKVSGSEVRRITVSKSGDFKQFLSDTAQESVRSKLLEIRDGIKLVEITKAKGADWSTHSDPQVRELYKTSSRKYPEAK